MCPKPMKFMRVCARWAKKGCLKCPKRYKCILPKKGKGKFGFCCKKRGMCICIYSIIFVVLSLIFFVLIFLFLQNKNVVFV